MARLLIALIGAVAVVAAVAGLLTGQAILSVVAALGAVVAIAVAVVERRTRVPYNLKRWLPRELTMPARATWMERPFVGWTRGWLGERRFVVGGMEDSVATIGIPRVGKTLGELVAQLGMWGGPAVSTSIRANVFRATAARRRQLAQQYGGDVYIYAPTAEGKTVEGLRPIHWSPLVGCEDAEVALVRVEALTDSAATGEGIRDRNHWKQGASSLLRPFFVAGAHHPVRPGNVAVVRDWLIGHDYAEPAAILRDLGTYAGDRLADELEGVQRRPRDEVGSFFSSALVTLAALTSPGVERSCGNTDVGAEDLLLSRSTVYIVSATNQQKVVAPLIAGFVDWIAHTAYRLHAEGRLDARLLLSLDELPNLAPLADPTGLLSQGGGQGVTTSWAAQSLAQLRERYGLDGAEAIWNASTVKIVFGGSTDAPTHDRLAAVLGDRRVKVQSRTVAPGSFGVGGSAQVVTSETWRPLLSGGELREIPQGWALLLYRQHPPYMVRVPIAFNCREFRPLFLPWEAPEAAPVVMQAEAEGSSSAS